MVKMLHLITVIIGTGTIILVANIAIVYHQNKRYEKQKRITRRNNRNRLMEEAIKQIQLENKDVPCDFKNSYRKGKEMRRQVEQRMLELIQQKK